MIPRIKTWQNMTEKVLLAYKTPEAFIFRGSDDPCRNVILGHEDKRRSDEHMKSYVYWTVHHLDS